MPYIPKMYMENGIFLTLFSPTLFPIYPYRHFIDNTHPFNVIYRFAKRYHISKCIWIMGYISTQKYPITHLNVVYRLTHRLHT